MLDLIPHVLREVAPGEKIIAGPFLLAPYPDNGCGDASAPSSINPCAAFLFKCRDHIGVKFAAAGRLPKNAARCDNEKTWTTGDVIEFFIQAEGRDDYYEFHLTPEGIRLQLHLPHYSLLRKVPFENKICDCGLAAKTLSLSDDLWVGEMRVPFASLSENGEEGMGEAKYCVSRYYYVNALEIEYSSYPPLPARGYHNPPCWACLKKCGESPR